MKHIQQPVMQSLFNYGTKTEEIQMLRYFAMFYQSYGSRVTVHAQTYFDYSDYNSKT